MIKVPQIYELHFVFENVEYGKIHITQLGQLTFENLTYDYVKRDDKIELKTYCENFSISIHKKAGKELSMFNENNKGDGIPLFQRILKYSDIVYIQLFGKYENDAIYLQYDSDNTLGANNHNQEARLNSRGDLFIAVSRNKEFKDNFFKTIENDYELDKIYQWDKENFPEEENKNESINNITPVSIQKLNDDN